MQNRTVLLSSFWGGEGVEIARSVSVRAQTVARLERYLALACQVSRNPSSVRSGLTAEISGNFEAINLA